MIRLIHVLEESNTVTYSSSTVQYLKVCIHVVRYLPVCLSVCLVYM